MRFASRITKARIHTHTHTHTHTHSCLSVCLSLSLSLSLSHTEYLILIAVPRQQWLGERAAVFHYTDIVCLVIVPCTSLYVSLNSSAYRRMTA